MRPFVLAFAATIVIAVPAITAWQTAGPPPAAARPPQLGRVVVADLARVAGQVARSSRVR